MYLKHKNRKSPELQWISSQKICKGNKLFFRLILLLDVDLVGYLNV